MKTLILRVSKGLLKVNRSTVATIEKGLALFVSIEKNDSDLDLVTIADKILNLRIFENENGRLDYSIKDKNYEVLCIPNFTLSANTTKGRRPSFENSMEPQLANKLFDDFIFVLKSKGINVQAGIFGVHMDIDLELDGPVNIILESRR